MRNVARASGKTLWPWRTRTRIECSSPTAYRHAATRSQKTLESILFLHLRFYDGERIANDPVGKEGRLAAISSTRPSSSGISVTASGFVSGLSGIRNRCPSAADVGFSVTGPNSARAVRPPPRRPGWPLPPPSSAGPLRCRRFPWHPAAIEDVGLQPSRSGACRLAQRAAAGTASRRSRRVRIPATGTPSTFRPEKTACAL